MADHAYLPATNSANPAIQNARNGRSDSSELPLITNAGAAMNSSAAAKGCSEKRRATNHILMAATSENVM
jgi:hypothetical protein